MSVSTLIDKARVDSINQAKCYLPSIIDTVIICGHLGISLKVHRDDKKLLPAGNYSKSSGLGNFVELLNYA